MARCVIIGGASIGDYAHARGELRPDDWCVFCDCGLRHRAGLGREPDLVVGDFDSHPDPHLAAETITLPHVKDDTDTVYAVKEALARGYDDFLLLGAVGERLDHTLGNVGILLQLDSQGKRGRIVDDYGDMEIVSRAAQVPDTFAYFSLLAVDGPAEGVTVENALYPLQNGRLTGDYPLGVSNEPLPGRTARVTVTRGRLLLIRVL